MGSKWQPIADRFRGTQRGDRRARHSAAELNCSSQTPGSPCPTDVPKVAANPLTPKSTKFGSLGLPGSLLQLHGQWTGVSDVDFSAAPRTNEALGRSSAKSHADLGTSGSRRNGSCAWWRISNGSRSRSKTLATCRVHRHPRPGGGRYVRRNRALANTYSALPRPTRDHTRSVGGQVPAMHPPSRPRPARRAPPWHSQDGRGRRQPKHSDSSPSRSGPCVVRVVGPGREASVPPRWSAARAPGTWVAEIHARRLLQNGSPATAPTPLSRATPTARQVHHPQGRRALPRRRSLPGMPDVGVLAILMRLDAVSVACSGAMATLPRQTGPARVTAMDRQIGPAATRRRPAPRSGNTARRLGRCQVLGRGDMLPGQAICDCGIGAQSRRGWARNQCVWVWLIVQTARPSQLGPKHLHTPVIVRRLQTKSAYAVLLARVNHVPSTRPAHRTC